MIDLLRGPIRLVRLTGTSIGMGLAQIWANKTRSVLTTLGIVIGVAAVTTVIAALTGYKTFVLKQFESFGTNKIYILPWQPQEGRMRKASSQRIRFLPEQFEGLLEHCPSVAQVTLRCGQRCDVVAGDRTLEASRVEGVEPSWHAIENRSVTFGRPFMLIDNLNTRPVCLINANARDELRLDRDPTGQSIVIDGRRHMVIGILADRTEPSLLDGRTGGAEVMIPFQTAWRMWGTRVWPMAIATSHSPELSDDARAEIRFFLRRARNLRPDDPDTFRMEVLGEILESFKQVATVATFVAFCIVAVSLLVGGVGIMNIMLVSVSERTREIGLRKAVGARPSVVLLQFLMEAVMLCCIGGGIGLGIGQLFTLLMASLTKAGLEHASIPMWAVILAFGFSAAVGVIFGMFPAIKAARLDPIEALRHE